MEILIGLIIVAVIGIGKLLEDNKTKNMTSDQRFNYEWDKLNKKYHFRK